MQPTASRPAVRENGCCSAFAHSTDSMRLVLQCPRGKPRVYVTTGKCLGARTTALLTRTGDAKAETKQRTHVVAPLRQTCLP
jgi:hypothetical protein